MPLPVLKKVESKEAWTQESVKDAVDDVLAPGAGSSPGGRKNRNLASETPEKPSRLDLELCQGRLRVSPKRPDPRALGVGGERAGTDSTEPRPATPARIGFTAERPPSRPGSASVIHRSSVGAIKMSNTVADIRKLADVLRPVSQSGDRPSTCPESPKRNASRKSLRDAMLGKPKAGGSGIDGSDASRREECRREREIGENARILNWTVDVQHETIHRVHATLCASQTKTVRSIGGDDVPACLIEVAAEGPPTAAGGRGEKLIRCSGSLVPRNSRLHVNWLGRTGAKGFTEVARGRPEILSVKNAKDVGMELGGAANKSQKTAVRTIAQGVLATLAHVSSLFGMIIVELDAEDNGSGKLVKHYVDLGFRVTNAMPGFDVEMEVPMGALMKLAPKDWIDKLIPKDFDAWSWLQPADRRDNTSDHDPVRGILLAPDVPWAFTWKTAYPADGQIDAKLALNTIDGVSARVGVEVFLKSVRRDEELAFARGAIRIKQKTLRVIWFGRSRSRVVHDCVRGKLAYAAGDSAADDSEAAPNITSATAVLGVLAGLARWFACETVHIIAVPKPGDTEGKLLGHLQSLGFAEVAGGTPVAQGDPVAMSTSCEDLALRCCPPEWRSKLPPDAGLCMLAGLIR